MNAPAHFGVLLLIMTFTAYATGLNFSCTANGKTISNGDTITHENGCTILQCQFSDLVPYNEGCGKDIDGSCHRLNSFFQYQGNIYGCKKVDRSGTTIYENQLTAGSIKNCLVEGQTYQNLETFNKGDECQIYQCQDGNVTQVQAACSKGADGQCHFEKEIFKVNSTIYTCATSQENGITVYQTIPLKPQPSRARDCTSGTTKYSTFEIFKATDGCRTRQCQDGAANFIAYACSFPKEKKCYLIGQQWIFDYQTFQCTVVVENGISFYRNIVVESHRRCRIGEQMFNHLDMQSGGRVCLVQQCQDGKAVPISQGCYYTGDSSCHDIGSIWLYKETYRKCTYGEGVYTISTLDANGNEIPKEETTPIPTINPNSTCPSIEADIIFIVDSSGSIGSANFRKQLDFIARLTCSFRMGPKNVRFGLVVFSYDAVKMFGLGDYEDCESISKAIYKTPYLMNITETHKAFNLIVDDELFATSAGGRDNSGDIVIVLTDGNSTDTKTTLTASDRLKARGIQVICVGIGKVSELEMIGMAGGSANVFKTPSFAVINLVLDELSKRTCSVPNEPPVAPKEPSVSECPNVVADIIFALDSSAVDGGSENYPSILELAGYLTKAFDIGTDKIQIGAILINTIIQNAFDLNKYATRSDVSKALLAVEHLQGERNTEGALDFVKSEGLFTAAHGARPNAVKILVLFLLGPSRNANRVLSLAKNLRNQDVRIIAIRIGVTGDREPAGLTGNSKNLFQAASSQLLNFIKETLSKRLCEVPNEPAPVFPEPPRCSDTIVTPCAHSCVNLEAGFECQCRIGYVVSPSDPFACDDKNECTDKSARCQQECTNTPGSFECSCRPGFTVDVDDESKCLDVDECETSPCQQECSNTVGSYQCLCSTGYRVSDADPASCEEIDKCANSPCQHVCSGAESGYTCSCNSGFQVSREDHTQCEDIDECDNSPCQQTCTNTDGSYLCYCNNGYVTSSNDPTKCEDVDECSNSPCEHSCSNSEGSFECLCNTGYHVSPTNPTKCEVTDKCSSSPCQHVCSKTEGGFKCSCNSGYKISSTDSTQCEDVDECTPEDTNPCQHNCLNTIGGYQCSCRDGYLINPADPNKCDVKPCSVYVKSDIIVVMDSSGSIGLTNYKIARGFAVQLATAFKLGPKDVQFAGVIFSYKTVSLFNLNAYYNLEDIKQVWMRAPYLSGGTFTHEALESINEDKMFGRKKGGRDDAVKIVIVITDGRSFNSKKTIAAANALKMKNCTVIAIGVTDSVDPVEIKLIASTRDDAFFATDYTTLQYIETKVAQRTCKNVADCSTSPCQHSCTNTDKGFTCSCNSGYKVSSTDGTRCEDKNECLLEETNQCQQNCLNTIGGYQCSCKDGYVINPVDPKKCDVKPCSAHIQADIIFVMDSSGSIGLSNYKKSCEFVTQLTAAFEIGPNDVQFAGIVFSQTNKVLSNLKDYYRKADIANLWMNAPYLNSGTYTHLALQRVIQDNMFGYQKGGRTKAEKIVIVITDGRSASIFQTIRAATALKNHKYTVIAIGVTNSVDPLEIFGMASTKDDAHFATDYKALQYIATKIAQKTCKIQSG